jgi:ubiquinone/menaquinone biosynthesis C-methylase UbiE
MTTPEEAARRIFGRRADKYTTSAAHTDPQVLARVVELSAPEPDWAVLDVGTGTGHTAFALAPHVASVIGIDLTPEMLAEAEKLQAQHGLANVYWTITDVHRLPFGDAAFQLIACRRAAHHFSSIHRSLREMRRVLSAGGRLVIDDRSVPEDDFVDACMNQLDRYHDESHVRQYRPSEWRQMLEALGFAVEAVEPYIKHRPLTSLTDRVSQENVRRIHKTLDQLDDSQREALNLVEAAGQLYLNHWYVMVSARRR